MNPKSNAFPVNNDLGSNYQGLIMRDYIAIEAMKALTIANGYTDAESIAKSAYIISDTLIKESNK